MIGYLLDTNVPSEAIRIRGDERVDAWIRSRDDESLYLSAITIGEFRRDWRFIPKATPRTASRWLETELIPMFAGRILPVTQAIAERWGALSGRRQQMGRPLGMADGLIAATALEHGLIVVTRNVKDFEGLDLRFQIPWIASD